MLKHNIVPTPPTAHTILHVTTECSRFETSCNSTYFTNVNYIRSTFEMSTISHLDSQKFYILQDRNLQSIYIITAFNEHIYTQKCMKTHTHTFNITNSDSLTLVGCIYIHNTNFLIHAALHLKYNMFTILQFVINIEKSIINLIKRVP